MARSQIMVVRPVQHFRLCLLALLLAAFGGNVAYAADSSGGADAVRGNVAAPGAGLWREVRAGPPPAAGSSQVQGNGAATLIVESGETWRIIRQQYLIPWGGWLLAAMLAGILLYQLGSGPPHTPDESSGECVPRFEVLDRILHWMMAGLVIFLGLSGLILLLGRFLILPLVGPEAFSAIASACKEGHNLFGPIFIVTLLGFFLRFLKRNLYARGDMAWLASGGGLLGHGHPPVGFFNAGEKIMFWIVILVGVGLSVSGVVLVFPQFDQPRELMQIAMVIHGLAAIGLIALVIGHAYLAGVAVPGTLDAMSDGRVGVGWASTHHDGWYKECREKGLIEQRERDL